MSLFNQLFTLSWGIMTEPFRCALSRKEGNHHHHPAKLKRGRKAKTMSHMKAEDAAADSEASETVTRPASTGIAKNARHGRRNDWATVAKAVKEPAYRGPWVGSKEDVADDKVTSAAFGCLPAAAVS